MGRVENSHTKQHYRALRALSRDELWSRVVPDFNAAPAEDRLRDVSVIRAVGVAFCETEDESLKPGVREWLVRLLEDPQEKVRRYAINALPKIGLPANGEAKLLDLMATTVSETERHALNEALQKLGGTETLSRIAEFAEADSCRVIQKARANVARSESLDPIDYNQLLNPAQVPEIHLICRSGLERVASQEFERSSLSKQQTFTTGIHPGCMILKPRMPFQLSQILTLRSFSSLAFPLGSVPAGTGELDQIASIIASQRTEGIIGSITHGECRYRLEFASRGHQRGAIRAITDRVFELNPAMINDARGAPWQITIHESRNQLRLEAVPRLRPDPRFAYRLDDIPAASHPPLAAAMAFLGEPRHDDVIWDPFCGSGLELVECGLLSPTARLIGSDIVESVLPIAAANVQSAGLNGMGSSWIRGDFRDLAGSPDSIPGPVSLIISNPPMGRRVPIRDLRGLISDFFDVAADLLSPGGRMIFANPVAVQPTNFQLSCQFRQRVDLGGFDVHVEKYVRRG